MAYSKKTWVNRESQYPNRYRMTSQNGNVADVAIVPNEGSITAEGDKFDAATMNDMESRIKNAFDSADSTMSTMNTTLRGLINAEQVRATGEENLLRHDVDENSSNISSEIARAQNAESALGTRITNETTRATGIENGLRHDVTVLQNDMDNAESDIDTLTTRIATLEQDIELETDRAEDAETELDGKIDSETARAESAETLLQTNITNETTRAQGAESTLQTNITAEQTRATTVESTLSSNIAAESTRAQQAESDLHDYVDQQITRTYKPSGSIIFSDLPALAQSRLNNVYDIRDAFTTTADFTDGAGIDYPAGTNVAIIDRNGVLLYDCLPGHNVTGVKGEAESDYRIGAVNITKANIGLGNVGNFKAVSTIANQGLTEAEKQAARANIGAGSESQTVTVDTELSTTSENPVQNKVITTKMNTKYGTDDSASTTISDTDYVPMSDTNGTKKKTLWSTIIAKIKASLSKSDVGLGNVPNVSTNDQTPTFSQASSRANIASGEKLSTIFGKIMKVIADLKSVAFSGSYNDLSNKPNYALSPSAGGAASNVYTPRVSTDYNSDLPGANKTKIVEHNTESPNRPTNNWYYVITSQGGDAAYATQLALGMTTKALYYRRMDANTWSDWEKVYTTGQAMFFDADFKTKFRTETKGDAQNGPYIANIRTDDAVADSSRYGAGLAWGQADTHGYLDVGYNDGTAYIGGGNQDKLNWVERIYTTGYKPSKSDVGLGNVDNTADANKSVYYSSFTGNIRRFDYVSDTDLNNYNQTGICNVTSDSQAKVTKHFPVGTASGSGSEAGILFVENADNNGTYIKQTYITRSGRRMFTRIFDIFTGKWSDWISVFVPKKIPELFVDTDITSLTDTNGFIRTTLGNWDGLYMLLIQTTVSTPHDIFVIVGDSNGEKRTVAQQYMTYMYQCLNVTLPIGLYEFLQVKTAVPNCSFHIRIHRVTE